MLTRLTCIFITLTHLAAALVPAVAGPIPRPNIPHDCPAPEVRHKVACPSELAVARGAPYKCLHTIVRDRCSEL